MTADRFTRRGLVRVGIGAAVGSVLGGTVIADERSAQRSVQEQGAYTDVYQETIDDVVLVSVAGEDGETPGGVGSGFVTEDGYVVTNDHVVMGTDELELQFRDEQWRTASVLGTDIHSDLAVLEVDDLPDAVDGLTLDPDDPVIGEEVLALGNPLGLDASISQGIVSGVDRSLPSPTGFSIPAAIQTDAPVNPGNSGGPLVTLDGDVRGVVFAGIGQTIGFAIPAQLADRVVPSLIDDGEYDHPYLGVVVEPVTPSIAEGNDLDESRGVLVVETISSGPAEDTLEPVDSVTTVDGAPVPTGGDVIVSIDDDEIPNQDRLSSVLALQTAPDETADIEVIREGDRQSIEVTLDSRPEVEFP